MAQLVNHAGCTKCRAAGSQYGQDGFQLCLHHAVVTPRPERDSIPLHSLAGPLDPHGDGAMFRETENVEKKPEPRKSERSKRLSKGRQEMLEVLQENEKEKMTLRREKRVLRLRLEKERERRRSLNKCKKEEQEKMKQRRDKRQAELTVEYLRNEEEQDRLFPS